MVTCTRRLEFDAAHRVLKHESKCKYLHGHRYAVEVTCEAAELDELGRVIDFGVVKEVLGSWIDHNLDHNTILNPADAIARAEPDVRESVVGRRPFLMPDDHPNPTAENLAILIYDTAVFMLPDEIRVERVRIYETPNCWADYGG